MVPPLDFSQITYSGSDTDHDDSAPDAGLSGGGARVPAGVACLRFVLGVTDRCNLYAKEDAAAAAASSRTSHHVRFALNSPDAAAHDRPANSVSMRSPSPPSRVLFELNSPEAAAHDGDAADADLRPRLRLGP